MCGPVIDVPQTVHSVQLQGTISICYRDCRWSGLMMSITVTFFCISIGN